MPGRKAGGGGTKPKKTNEPSRILNTLEKRGAVYVPSAQAARVLPKLKPEIERRFPGKRIVYERNQLRVIDIERKGSGFFGGLPEWVKNAPGDIPQLGVGIAGMLADYGKAGVGDIKDQLTFANARALARGDIRDVDLPFRRSAGLARRDIVGTIGALETAIPEPSWVPEWMRREVLTVDPEKGRIGRGSGRIDPK